MAHLYLIKMVAKNILYADERFETGGNEDCDLCLRAFFHKVKLTNITEKQIVTHPDTRGIGWDNIRANAIFYEKKWGTSDYLPGRQNYSLKKIDDIDWYPAYTQKWSIF